MKQNELDEMLRFINETRAKFAPLAADAQDERARQEQVQDNLRRYLAVLQTWEPTLLNSPEKVRAISNAYVGAASDTFADACAWAADRVDRGLIPESPAHTHEGRQLSDRADDWEAKLPDGLRLALYERALLERLFSESPGSDEADTPTEGA